LIWSGGWNGKLTIVFAGLKHKARHY